MVRSILWFRQDLRLHDNEALQEALRSSDELIPVFIFDPRQFLPSTSYGTPKCGVARTKFLLQSIMDLRQSLQAIGSNLLIRIGHQEEVLYDLALTHKVFYIYCNRERTREEVDVQDILEKKLWTIGCEIRYSRGKMLYYTSDLPFPVTHCPDSFSVFRKETEHLSVRAPLETPGILPPFPLGMETGSLPELQDLLMENEEAYIQYFEGGESIALKELQGNQYNYPQYLLAGERNLFSPWIAMGCLSPKRLYYESFLFESGGEEIQQNLVYRDYLRLMGKKYGDKIFNKAGTKGILLKTRSNTKSLVRWQQGQTSVSIIDAAMHQLNKTGWLPDALRRLVASYFIKVLNLDWRLGAAYFEARLIDYDPCTNWISWLNMAGIGPDTREDRIINYEAVGKRLDPEGIYINTWNSESELGVNS